MNAVQKRRLITVIVGIFFGWASGLPSIFASFGWMEPRPAHFTGAALGLICVGIFLWVIADWHWGRAKTKPKI